LLRQREDRVAAQLLLFGTRLGDDAGVDTETV